MARREATIVIIREGRDKGGSFALREMAAIPATEWFVRTMQLLVRSGADVPPNIMQAGPAGFITMGLGTVISGLGKVPWFEVKPLLDELLTCVTSYQPPGAIQPIMAWTMIQQQIEEPATVLQLYEEVLSLHLGFSLGARLSEYRQMAVTMMGGSGPIMSTSTEDAQSSSPGASPA